MYHTLLSEGLSSRGEPAPALDSLRAALDLAYADLCRWMVGWGMWGDTTELQVSASVQRCPDVFSALFFAPVSVLSARLFLGGRRFSAVLVSLQARVEEVLDRLDGGNDLGSEEGYAAAMERAYPLS